MYSADVKQRIEQGIPDTKAFVSEFSGGTDHYAVTIISSSFEGKPLIKRHRMVMELFQAEMKTGEVHALTLKTLTPSQYEQEIK